MGDLRAHERTDALLRKTPESGTQWAGPSLHRPTASAPVSPPAPSTTRSLLPAKVAHLQVASNIKAAPYERCQRLENYGLARTAERALLLALSDPRERVPRADGFDELMPKTMATATVDRLLHHAHVIITDGQDSYRLAQATAGKGVKPLT